MMWLVVVGAIVLLSIIGIILSHIFWRKDWADWAMPVSIIALVGSIILTIPIIFCRIDATKKIQCFEETRNMITVTVNSNNETENFGVTQAIIEKNTWLVEVKTSVKKYGMWSLYYGLGVEDLEYISLGS